MNYQQIYENVVEKASSENRKKHTGTYYENHHILPKCLGGIDDEINRVLLTFKEHFICHKLLTYVYPHNRKIACAYHRMTYNKRGKLILTSRDYLYARELISKTPITRETRQKMIINNSGENNPCYGRIKEKHPMYNNYHTCESKEKIVNKMKKSMIECKYCHKMIYKHVYTRYHGELCLYKFKIV